MVPFGVGQEVNSPGPRLGMLGADPFASLGMAGWVLLLSPVCGGHAVTALVCVGTLALVLSREDAAGALLVVVPLVAEGNGAVAGKHLARPLALLSNRAELDMLAPLSR